MSPVSRGRRKPKKRPAARSRATRPEPTLDGVHAEMLRAFRPLAREPDPLEVEVFTSGLLGSWWGRLPPGEDPDALFGLGAVEYAQRRGTREALALLHAIAALGDAEELRVAASTAAASLSAAGVAEPPWSGTIGRVRPGDCWRLGDVYGDQASLLCDFRYGGRRHGLVALVDFNHLDGWLKDVFITVEPARVLRELRAALSSQPLMTLEQVDPAEARRLLEDGFAATDMTWQPEVSEEFRQFRALALARCRAMPAPDGPHEPAPVPDQPEREAIVEEFLAAPPGTDLPVDADAARFCARLLVDFGADYDGGKPLRVSPAKLETFLHDWAPRKAVLEQADLDAMPIVVAAWAGWAGRRSGLPPEAVDEVVEVATECGGHFAQAYEEGADASPTKAFLKGLEVSGPEDLREAMDRRWFAMPYVGTRIGDEDHPALDPGDPDERRLLIEGEHPEYHDALTHPAFDGEIDGVNPNLHVAMHEIVANQLWDGDPPEAWRAARRLLDAGMERHDILHELGGVAMTQLHGALTSREPVDPAAYSAALDTLRPSQHTATAGTPAGNAVYQVKITLRGTKPPIWRRLRLPAGTTLPQLHRVIQAAFGWTDSHLHAFEADGRRYADPTAELGHTTDERRTRLYQVAPATGARIRYTYDFGDSWEHDILVEDVLPPDASPHAVCITGRRAAPPEDCGGVWGHQQLCEILADPSHPEHAERLEWLEGPYNPAAFDKDTINLELRRVTLA
jgi:hypothetical protein